MGLKSEENLEFLMSMEATIDETSHSISSGVDSLLLRLKGRRADQVRSKMVELGKISAGGSFIQNTNGQFEPTGVMEELDMLLEKDTSGVDVLALGEKDIFYDRSSQGLYLRKL